MLFLLALAVATYAAPLSDCITGGSIISVLTTPYGVARTCIRDDISIIKIESNQIANTTTYKTVATRFWNVKNWHKCDPYPTSDGTFVAYDIDKNFKINPVQYACRANCKIHIDKDEGCIVLSSDQINHYTVSGTMITSGWFKSKTNIPLSNTCEHITIACGNNQHTVHACFKTHMTCMKVFKNTYMPNKIAMSFCTNIELILMTTFSLIVYLLLWILSGTYLIYLLLPIFWPIAYIFAKCYSRSCILCSNCHLPIHPLSKCGTECICGVELGSTERLKKHRDSMLCKGYKSGPAARALCRNKGSNLILSIFLSILFFSFITPINAECIELDYINDYICPKFNVIEFVIELVLVTIILILPWAIRKLTNLQLLHCSECKMYHSLKGLKRNGDFTNKCETCECGFEPRIYEEAEYIMPIKDIHITKDSCKNNLILKNNSRYRWIIIILLITLMASPCYSLCDYKNLELCGNYNLTVQCNHDKNQEELKTYLKSLHIMHDIEFHILDHIQSKTRQELLLEVEKQTNNRSKIILEKIAESKFCTQINKNKYNLNNALQGFRVYISANELSICKEHKENNYCNCIQDISKCTATRVDHSHALKFYNISTSPHWNHDINILLKATALAFPGIVSNVLYIYLKSDKIDEAKSYIRQLADFYSPNRKLYAVLNLLELIINYREDLVLDNYWSKFDTIVNLHQENLQNISMIPGQALKKCTEPKNVTCSSKLPGGRAVQYLECNGKHFYMPEDYSCFKQQCCVYDYLCDHDFKPYDNKSIVGLYCHKSSNIEENIWSKTVKSCKLLDIGFCLIKNVNKSVVLCEDNLIFATERTIHHHGTPHVSDFCFDKDCTQKRPIHPINVQNCVWESHKMHKIQSLEINYESIESYKNSLESNIEGDLNSHGFKPLSNLPKVIPQYLSLTIRGTNTENGLTNTFIEGEMAIITGNSNGLKIYSPNGVHLFDIVLYIRKADYSAAYRELYKTGPTTTINVQHNEKCTGKCPIKNELAVDGYIGFEKEHTSSWGCEEFGCLAIDTGCLYGACKDVILPELTVYNKVEDDKPNVEFCLTTPIKTLCSTINILEPLVLDKFEFAFENTEIVVLPEIVGIKKNKVYTGQINNLESFGSYCGNAKIIGNTTVGQGTPEFDYICHPASRKDVIVRKCFANNYHACSLLRERQDLIINPDENGMVLHKKMMKLGTLRYKVKLGDVDYKTFVENIEFTAKGKCAGNILSDQGVSCQIEIDINKEATCLIISNCKSFINKMHIMPSIMQYNLKFICVTEEITIQICNNIIPIEKHIIRKEEIIDVVGVDESHYVEEKDNRCGTWLCKVVDEGFESIFYPIFGTFTKYVLIPLIIIGIIICCLMFYFFILPLCRTLKRTLEEQATIDTIARKYR
ncbi:M polyprotein [Ness Ziona virus]|uniref:Envelopment polyprotein n=1 Tax=Ness Ziona virus TaxID=2544873 RepID=A0A481U603_9VIRU|nr:M polyprotein [Ness Ziona virus]QBH98893.1 M polyprotein [Ness Ziona virus]